MDKTNLDAQKIWQDYQLGKQTYEQLALKYACSKRTIQRLIDKYQPVTESSTPRRVIVLMDTTYWGRNFGVMLFKDAITKKNLLKYYVKTETNYLYKKGIEQLQASGFEVIAIVCDGRKGLLNLFEIPTQMCQFHQSAIIRRYITKKPKLPAAIELKSIVNMMINTDKDSFQGALNEWHSKWSEFLNQRTPGKENGKSYYTHKRLRSAYRSLKTNTKFLFTWYDHFELNIPNTTNAIDGHFADLKNKLRNHNGLTISRKMKFIDGFLKV